MHSGFMQGLLFVYWEKKKKKMPWKGRVCPRVCPRFFNLEGSDTRGNPSNGTNFSWDSTARKKTNTSQYP